MQNQINDMKCFNGIEYIAIDVANSFGHDKMEFEDRIKWVKDNIDNLEALESGADKKTLPLYRKAVMALRKAMKGEATGHLVGLDAACSGMQIMSAMTGCIAGAAATGLVNPNKRADAYTIVTETMNQQEGILVKVPRSDAKAAVMTLNKGVTL